MKRNLLKIAWWFFVGSWMGMGCIECIEDPLSMPPPIRGSCLFCAAFMMAVAAMRIMESKEFFDNQ